MKISLSLLILRRLDCGVVSMFVTIFKSCELVAFYSLIPRAMMIAPARLVINLDCMQVTCSLDMLLGMHLQIFCWGCGYSPFFIVTFMQGTSQHDGARACGCWSKSGRWREGSRGAAQSAISIYQLRLDIFPLALRWAECLWFYRCRMWMKLMPNKMRRTKRYGDLQNSESLKVCHVFVT